jgi:hypothetical protein
LIECGFPRTIKQFCGNTGRFHQLFNSPASILPIRPGNDILDNDTRDSLGDHPFQKNSVAESAFGKNEKRYILEISILVIRRMQNVV